MDKNQSNVDEFFAKLPTEDKTEANIFDEEKPKAEQVVGEKTDGDEELPEDLKNRHIRRTERRLQAEREANIALNARLQTLSEMDKFAKDNEGEVLPDIAKMFDSSDAGKENALRLSKALMGVKEEAKAEALREIEQQQTNLAEEQRQYEDVIDNELESIETEYNIDITSDAPKARKARKEFLELIQEVSPKDENGDIIAYADFDATFRQYQKDRTEVKDNSRREEIASRGMQRSSTVGPTPRKITPGFDGWKTDYEGKI